MRVGYWILGLIIAVAELFYSAPKLSEARIFPLNIGRFNFSPNRNMFYVANPRKHESSFKVAITIILTN